MFGSTVPATVAVVRVTAEAEPVLAPGGVGSAARVAGAAASRSRRASSRDGIRIRRMPTGHQMAPGVAGTLRAMSGRFSRGWALTKESWAVVRADRSLIVFPVVSGIAAIVTAAVFFGVGAGIADASDQSWVVIPFVVVGLYLLIVIGIFCSVALTACAARALEGHDTTFGEGIAAARQRFGIILQWALVQFVVGALMAALEALLKDGAGAIVGNIVGGIANLAWTVATYFAIPAIALEGLGPKAALKRSAHVVKERWGEGVIGAGAIGLIFMLAGFLPAIALIAVGVVIVNSSAIGAGVLIAVGVLVFIVALMLQTTVVSVFKVALFRFATEDAVLGTFERDQLEHAFKPKKGRRAA